MRAADLAQLPDWPALMDVETATLYLGGKRKLLQALSDGGLIHRFTDSHKCVTYRREEIDRALRVAGSMAEHPQTPPTAQTES